MAKTKKTTLEQVLELVPANQKMMVQVYAYGVAAANTYNDGMITAGEIKEGTRRDILLARVTEIRTSEPETKMTGLPTMLYVAVEMVM